MLDALDNAYPLTPLQQGMLYEALKNPDTNVYIAYIVVDISGELDSALFKAAWRGAVQQHETLRTRFLWEGLDAPLQLVNSSVELDWVECDSSQTDFSSAESTVDHWLDHERSQPLGLTDTPPMRFRLIRLSDGHSTLIWTVHHLLADDWSTPLVLQSVADHYCRSLSSSNLTRVSVDSKFPFVTYVNWLTDTDREQHRQWWKRTLQGVKPTSIKPEYGRTRYDLDQTPRHQRHVSQVNKKLSALLMEKSRTLGVTQSSILHVAWALVIARFSGRGEALFGTSVSGRTCPLSDIDTAVGLFLNTIPTHISINPNQPLDDFIKEVQRQLFEQIEHEHVPLTDLQRLLPVDDNRLMFESVLVVETHGSDLQIEVPDSNIVFGNIRYFTDSNFPLTVLVFPGESMQVHLVGLESYFDHGAFAALSTEFIAVLNDICRPGETQLTQVLENQSQRINAFYQATPLIDKPVHASVIDWIRSTALDQPESVSIIDDDVKYSYAQLLFTAEQIAAAVHEQNSKSAFVGVCLERGFTQIAAILGVMLSGKAYVPIDPQWPSARSDEILNASQITVLVSNSSNASCITTPDLSIVLADQLTDDFDSYFIEQQARCSDDPAYMIFTSGSTGQPKGVVISNLNLMYSTTARIAYYPDSPRCYLLLSSFAFDSSVAGIFWTLCTGGSLVLPGAGKAQDIHDLEFQISRHQVSHTLCLPSIYQLLLRYADSNALQSLNTVIVAGEECPASLPGLHHQVLPSARLYNEYGPTEGTVWSTVAELQPPTSSTISRLPIGHPIPGTRVRVVNQSGDTCPPGISGELLVMGPGVAQGYHGDAKLSGSRFISLQDGSARAANQRAYKTGDLVTLGYDGQLYFLGRVDHQLKIRGHRIEAGEITSRIERHPGVLEAFCFLQNFARSDATDVSDKRLVCFYTLADQPKPGLEGCHLIEDPLLDELIKEIQTSTACLIKQELPAQFAVFKFVAVNSLPRLPNGKIDIAGFPSMSSLGAKSEHEFSNLEVDVATNDTESRLCHLLARLLGIPAAPPDENFFTLGGDSLTAIRFVAAARELGIPLTVPMITEHASIRELANATGLYSEPTDQSRTMSESGETPLTPIQRWFFSNAHSRLSHWNMAFIVGLGQAVSVKDITKSIFKAVEEFPVLGASFVKSPDGYLQCIPESVKDESLVQCITPPENRLQWVEALSSAQVDFNLESGIVARFLVAANEDQTCLQFGVVVHHLVTDALSNWYLTRRIMQLLRGDNGPAKSGISLISYREWSMRLQQDFPYIEPASATGPDFYPGTWTEEQVEVQTLELSPLQLSVIRKFCDHQSVALHEYLLFLLMSSGSFTSETRIDIETHGRDLLEPAIDASASVGWFTSFFPIVVTRPQDVDLKQFTDIFRRGKKENTHQFTRDPVEFFNKHTGASQSGLNLQPVPLLYNFLAMDMAGSDQLDVEGFELTPLTDSCFRDSAYPRSHPIELLVTDRPEGLALVWRVDKLIAERIGLAGWIERCHAMIQDQADNPQNAKTTVNVEDFPDSGMDADELSRFLDNLN